jgi:hypothetical protein
VKAAQLDGGHIGLLLESEDGPKRLAGFAWLGNNIRLVLEDPVTGRQERLWIKPEHDLSVHTPSEPEEGPAAFPADPVADGYVADVSQDVVRHPSHYGSGRFGIECIAISRLMAFEAGNAFKYVFRWQEKNQREDLRKALVYLEWVIGMESPIWLSPRAMETGRRLIAEHIEPALPVNLAVYEALREIGQCRIGSARAVVLHTLNTLDAGQPAPHWKDTH